MAREQQREYQTAEMISDFPMFVDRYDEITPFNRVGQLDLHRQTIKLRREHRTATGALLDPRFIESLYATLRSWGIGTRASVLVPIDQFGDTLQSWSFAFEELDQVTIDDPLLDVAGTEDRLWRLITGVDIVENRTKLVALSKTIHHVLPDLLPPIDSAYTQRFFAWDSVEFQDEQERVFRSIWQHFVTIARETDPEAFVGEGWRTSRTKVIDNAIVAYVRSMLPAKIASPRSAAPAPSRERLSNMHSLQDLYDKLAEFETELESAGLKPNSVVTYVGRSKTFVDWLAGRYQPRGPNTT